MILESAEVEENRAELRQVLLSMYRRAAPAETAVQRADMAAAGEGDPALWQRLTGELGGAGLAVPVEYGGGGASLAELAVLFEVDGARLGCVPLLGTVLALEALLRSGDQDATTRWVPHLAGGTVRGALAWTAEDVTVQETDDGPVLDGSLPAIPDVVGADLLLLPVGEALAVVRTADAEVSVLESLDLTRPLSRVTLAGTPAVRLGGRAASEVLDEVRDVAAVLLATELLGVADQALGDAVAYAKEREQFGRAVGSFQALKHTLADMATAADLARSLVEHATWSAVEKPARLREAAAMAFVAASDAAAGVTAENVQVHGGIGFSWEHAAHLYFRKARADAALLGGRHVFADRLLTAVGAIEDGRA